MKRRRLYLHIGHPKTGTSSLQHYLLQQEQNLRRHGLLFPISGRPARDNPVHFRLFPGAYYHQDREDGSDAERARLEDEIARLDPDAVVLSCETAFAENAELLRQAFAAFDVTILYYIRRQDLWIPSFYAQRIKYARMPEFRPLSGMLDDWIPPYLKTLRRFAEVFGRDHVKVRPFEQNAWNGGDLIRDFLHEIGLDPAGFPAADRTLNESLKPDYQRFLLACNQLPLLSGEAAALRRAMADLSARDPRRGSDSLLDNETRRLILDRCAADNAAIAREFLGREDGLLFRDPFVEQPRTWSETDPLPPAVQHDLFNRLPVPVQSSLAAVSPSIRNRVPGTSFLPDPCPPDPDSQNRIWCCRECWKLARLTLGETLLAPVPETMPEQTFFDELQNRLSLIRASLSKALPAKRPDLAEAPPSADMPLDPDCAALARACLLLPLFPGERRELMLNLLSLSGLDPEARVQVSMSEERHPFPPPVTPQPPSERQHALISRLTPAVRQRLTFHSPEVREACQGLPFWPVIPDTPAGWRRQVLQRDIRTLYRYLEILDSPTLNDPPSKPAPWTRLKRLAGRFFGIA